MVFPLLILLSSINGIHTPIDPELAFFGAMNDSVEVVSLAQDLYLKYAPDTPKKREIIAKNKIEQQQLQKISLWIDPVVRISTEQSNGVSILCRVPFNKSDCLWWIEPSIYKLGRNLFAPKFSDKWEPKQGFSRLGFGSGFRSVFAPGWVGGIYGYYDYTTKNSLNQLLKHRCIHSKLFESYESINYLDVQHTLNMGVELFMPKGRMIGNLYRKYMASGEGYSSYAYLSGDIKLAIDYQRLTVSVGGYYDHGVLACENEQLRALYRVPILREHIKIYGSAIELKYAHSWKVYCVKFTYDNLERYSVSLGVEWHPLKFYSTNTSSKQGLNLQPTERYLRAAQVNSNGVNYLMERSVEILKTNKKYDTEEHREAWRSKQRNVLRKFYTNFTERYGERQAYLNQEERYTLHQWANKLKTLPEFAQWPAVVSEKQKSFRDKGVDGLCSENMLKQGVMDLPMLVAGRSITQHVLWLELLRLNNSFETGITFDDGKVEIASNVAQLKIINKFDALIGSYFAKKDAQALIHMQKRAEHDASVSFQLNLEEDIPTFLMRLSGLGQVAIKHSEFYDIIPAEGVPDTKDLQPLHQKLQAGIAKQLIPHRTALLLATCRYDQRRSLLYFSNLTPKQPTLLRRAFSFSSKLNELTLLRRFPYDIQREILRILLSDLIKDNGCIKTYDAFLSDKFASETLRLPNESEACYEGRLLDYHVSRLFPYLESIQTKEDYANFLAIPEHEDSRVLF